MLPLYDGPDGGPIERIGTKSPEYFAFWAGFELGAQGLSRSREYDPDPRVNQYYQDGHKVGWLFRPMPFLKERRR